MLDLAKQSSIVPIEETGKDIGECSLIQRDSGGGIGFMLMIKLGGMNVTPQTNALIPKRKKNCSLQPPGEVLPG